MTPRKRFETFWFPLIVFAIGSVLILNLIIYVNKENPDLPNWFKIFGALTLSSPVWATPLFCFVSSRTMRIVLIVSILLLQVVIFYPHGRDDLPTIGIFWTVTVGLGWLASMLREKALRGK